MHVALDSGTGPSRITTFLHCLILNQSSQVNQVIPLAAGVGQGLTLLIMLECFSHPNPTTS